MKPETPSNIFVILMILASIIIIVTVALTIVDNTKRMDEAEKYCTNLGMSYEHDGGADNSRCLGIEGNKVIVTRLHFIDGILYEESSLSGEGDKQ